MLQKRITIDSLSTHSLLIETYFNDVKLAQATGFIVNKDDESYLITNFHILAGRDPLTFDPVHPSCGIPDSVKILHHYGANFGSWKFFSYSLKDKNNRPLWIEHPSIKHVDLVALPIKIQDANIKILPFNLSLANTDLIPAPAMPICVIGFPLGITSGGAWPIWKTGHIATDPDLDYDSRPSFLIDATTREGMSGSPVVIRLNGGFNTRSGNMILAGGFTTKFLGVYSGRINDDAEIGRVWRPHLINEILNLQ